jgi:hypothetical protein
MAGAGREELVTKKEGKAPVTENELRRVLERFIPPELMPSDDVAQVSAAIDARMHTIAAEHLAHVLPQTQELAERVLLSAEPDRRTVIHEVAQRYGRICPAYFRTLDARGLRTSWGTTYMDASRDKDKRELLSKEKHNYKRALPLKTKPAHTKP